MKLCVYGAGAIGGLLGARLAQKGDVDVTFIARGPHLAAMQADGVRLISDEIYHGITYGGPAPAT